MLQIFFNRRFEKYFLPCLGGLLGGLSISSKYWLLMMPFSLGIVWGTSNFRIANFLWGFTFVSISHYWLIYLHPLTWMGFTWISSILIAILIWIACSSLGGILVMSWGYVVRVVCKFDATFDGNTFRQIVKVLFLSCLWGVGELILTQTPFFWIGISDSLVSGDLYLAGLARWIGASGLCVLQLLFGFWVFLLFRDWVNKNNVLKCFLYGLIINLFLHVIGLFLISPNDQETYKYPIAVWQTNIPTREKVFLNEKKLSQEIFSFQDQALSNNAKLLILPEGTLRSNFNFQEGFKINTLAGGFRLDGNNLKNSLLAFNKGDTFYSDFIDKFRLVPLGESVPNVFRKVFREIAAFGSLEQGNRTRFFEWVNSPKLAVAICYEIADGRGIKQAVENGSELILSIANLDPFPESIHSQFLSLARIRSIENNRENLIVSNTGPSGLIGGDGRIRVLFDPNIEQFDVLYPELQTTKTFFTNFGNLPFLTLFMGLFLLNIFYLWNELIIPPPKRISP